MADGAWDKHVAEQIGALTTSVKALTASVETLNHRLSAADRERHEIRKTVSDIERKLNSYEPDMKRCRLWRNWGAGTIILMGVGATVTTFWGGIRGAIAHLFRGLT